MRNRDVMATGNTIVIGDILRIIFLDKRQEQRIDRKKDLIVELWIYY